MFCSISGVLPKEPVVSKSSGLLFEKQLIVKSLKETGKCPISGEDMTEDDLIGIKANKALHPRSVTSTSIPGLLSAFQNEWDEIMLETFTLRQHLDATRQELSQALYQHDAACRLVARLTRERDEARSLISSLHATYGNDQNGKSKADSNAGTGEKMVVEENTPASNGKDSDVESPGLPAEVLSIINDKCKELSALRKGRKAPAQLTSRESMSSLTQVASYTPHKADAKSAVTCVALCSNFGEVGHGVILSGGTDKQAVLVEQSSGKVLGKLVGHSKKVNAVAIRAAQDGGSNSLITASADATVKLWDAGSSSGSGKYTEAWSYAGHTGEVTGLSLHPSGSFLSSVSSDGSWHFLDLARGTCLKAVPSGSSAAGAEYASVAFHPDGLILATGTNAGVLRVWDIREQHNVANCAEHTGSLNSIAFSENGYLVATGGQDGSVKIWDLRKLACTKTIEAGTGAVSSVSFDHSGTYLAVGGGGEGGQGLQVRVVKDWSESVNLDAAHTKPVTGVAWGQHASALVTCSADRTVRVFAPPQK